MKVEVEELVLFDLFITKLRYERLVEKMLFKTENNDVWPLLSQDLSIPEIRDLYKLYTGIFDKEETG